MSSTLLVFPLLGGVLGTFFFIGLRWSIRRALASPNPAFWFLGSLLVRSSLVLVGFQAMASSGWPALVLALLGFTMAREAILLQARRSVIGQEKHLASKL